MARLRNSAEAIDAATNLSQHMDDWIRNVNIKMFITCVTCQHLKNDRLCEVFNAQPPASVIIVGCDQYLDLEEVPF